VATCSATRITSDSAPSRALSKAWSPGTIDERGCTESRSRERRTPRRRGLRR
jgi:hypothetical protein